MSATRSGLRAPSSVSSSRAPAATSCRRRRRELAPAIAGHRGVEVHVGRGQRLLGGGERAVAPASPRTAATFASTSSAIAIAQGMRSRWILRAAFVAMSRRRCRRSPSLRRARSARAGAAPRRGCSGRAGASSLRALSSAARCARDPRGRCRRTDRSDRARAARSSAGDGSRRATTGGCACSTWRRASSGSSSASHAMLVRQLRRPVANHRLPRSSASRSFAGTTSVSSRSSPR